MNSIQQPVTMQLDHFALMSGVGLDAESSCTAVRCAIDNFAETGFRDSGGEPIVGSTVPLEKPWRGETKQLKMLEHVLRDCLSKSQIAVSRNVALLLCLAETQRVGRLIHDDQAFYGLLCERLELEFNAHSRVISQGAVSVLSALHRARVLLAEQQVEQVIIAAVDSLMVARTLADLERNDNLLCSEHSDGIIPGEGAGAFSVSRGSGSGMGLQCQGLGFAMEDAMPGSGLPFRADGMVTAIKGALNQTNCTMFDIDYRTVNASGDQFSFKEASLALTRTLKTKKDEFDLVNPADCAGDMGSASAILMLAVAADACTKGYAIGPRVIAQLGNRDGRRAAGVFTWQGEH